MQCPGLCSYPGGRHQCHARSVSTFNKELHSPNRASRHISLKSVSTHKIGCGSLSHRWIRVHGSVQPKVKVLRRFSRSAFRGYAGGPSAAVGGPQPARASYRLPYLKPNPTLALALAL